MSEEHTYEELRKRIVELEQKNNILQFEAMKYRTLFDSFPHGITVRESETRYRTVLETINEGVILQAASGKILTWNKGAEKIFGISAKETIGQTLEGKNWPAIHEDGLKYEAKDHPFLRTLRTGKPLRNEIMGIYQSSGDLRWISISTNPLFSENDDKPYAVTITCSDITEKKEAEEALRESEDKFSKVFQSAPLLMTITAVDDGRFLTVNDAFVSFTGYSREMAIGSTSTEIGFADIEDRNRVLNILKAEGCVRNLEINVKRSDGSRMVCLYSAELIGIDGRKRLISTAVDISDRKRAEDQLHERKFFLNTLIDAIPIPVFYKDNQGRYLGVNKAFQSFWGATRESLIGKSVFDINPPELANTYHAKDKELLESGGVQKYESQVLDDKGNIRDVIFNKAVFRDSRKNIKGLIGAILDVTELRMAEKEKMEIEVRLQQAQRLESIGNLAGGIAHDFNNILFPIIGLAEMLVEDLSQNSPERENAEEILRAGKRGSDLVKQILAFSRQSEQKKMPIHMQQILKEVITLSRSSIPSNIKIIQNIQSDCGMVMADPTQLHQVAMNLITNAYHAVEHIDGKISVQLREKRLGTDDVKGTSLKTGQHLMLSVSDNGCGIDPNIINSIFEPYFTTKDQGKGTGLGLAVVYGIVKDYKGDIKIYSEVGKGTTFNIFIPLVHQLFEKIAFNEEMELIKGGSESILLVDDEEAIVRLERQMLERLGYRVATRLNSRDAFEAFKANPDMYDLVLTDMTMPNMTGDKLAEALMAIKPDIPIIICTGFSERISEEMVKSTGIKGLLMKPVIKSEMARLVRKVLDETEGGAQE